MEEIKRKIDINNILRYLIMFMIIFVSVIVVASILTREFDTTGIIAGIIFILFLMTLKWLIREIGIE